MNRSRPRLILLSCLAGALINIYFYMVLILLSFQSETFWNFFSWTIGSQRIPLFGRLPWCLLAQILGTLAFYAWWSRFPLPSLRVAYGIILGLIVNALIINGLVLW